MHTPYKFRLKDIPWNYRFSMISIFGWSTQFMFLTTLYDVIFTLHRDEMKNKNSILVHDTNKLNTMIMEDIFI